MPSVTIRGGFLRQQKTNEQNDRVLLHFVKPFTLFPWHRVWHFRPRSFFCLHIFSYITTKIKDINKVKFSLQTRPKSRIAFTLFLLK